MTMLEVAGLRKGFGLKPVLRGVDLRVEAGERVALLGSNGAGKTTLLRILAGLIKADTGRICIQGLDMSEEAQQIRSLIGLVGHQPYLYEELSVLENLLFFGQMYNVQHGRERALALIQRVGLERKARDRVKTLSRGQVQRVAWARALLHSPRLLLLDEPDTGLDQEGTSLIEELLTEHTAQGVATLFTTHQLERALVLSDSVVMLAHGRIAYHQQTSGIRVEGVRQVYEEVMR